MPNSWVRISPRDFTDQQWAELFEVDLTDSRDRGERVYNVERSMVERAIVHLESRIDAVSLGVWGPEDLPGDDIRWIASIRGAIRVLQGKLSVEVAA